MFPPLLLMTTITNGVLICLIDKSAFESCKNARSPIMQHVGDPEETAVPSAVDRMPSIPAAPLFKNNCPSGDPKRAASRTGNEFESITFQWSGRFDATWLKT